MILVTGATGTVGREVVAQLVAAGQEVRAMTRNPAKAKFDGPVEVIQGDFSDSKTLVRAVEGVERVFSLTVGPQTGIHERNLAQAAKRAGVRHIVKLSAMGGDEETRNTIRKWHDEGEQAIRETGIPLTVLAGRFYVECAALARNDSLPRKGVLQLWRREAVASPSARHCRDSGPRVDRRRSRRESVFDDGAGSYEHERTGEDSFRSDWETARVCCDFG